MRLDRHKLLTGVQAAKHRHHTSTHQASEAAGNTVVTKLNDKNNNHETAMLS